MDDTYDILRIIRSEGVGSITFQKLLKYFGNYKDIIKNISHFNSSARQIKIADEIIIEKEIKEVEKFGAKIITYKNALYPQKLRDIPDFPPVITIIGNVSLLNKKCVAIIGARNSSANGNAWTRKIAKEISDNDYVVVSGMATGIDTSAHHGSLENGTIAVLGGGIDNIYPRENNQLYYDLLKKGLIISEQPFGTAPRAENFPARNRIITALSNAIIVVEAGAKSGTLRTANIAIEQGKEIMVVPGNPYDPRNEGSNKLIKDGATVVTNIDDILYELENITPTVKKDIKQKELKFNIDTGEVENNRYEKKIVFEKENKEKTMSDSIMEKLNNTPIEIELLAQELNIPLEIINPLITELELEGKILVEFGKVMKKY